MIEIALGILLALALIAIAPLWLPLLVVALYLAGVFAVLVIILLIMMGAVV